MSVVFSGVQPTGNITIGNYFGAMKYFKDYQDEYDSYFCIVNQHAITVRQDPKMLRENTLNLAILYLALGIDPYKATVFVQSDVPEHLRLGWIMTTISNIGELQRMTQFKDKAIKNQSSIPTGLLTYPPLMAADILLYNTNFVPVGEDQQQHLELTRDLAIRFNSYFGNILTIPEIKVHKVGARIMSLQSPTKKMSKSDRDQNGVISLFDNPDIILKKIKRAVTDSSGEITFNKNENPGISNLLTIMSLCTGLSIAKLEQQYLNLGYGIFKDDVAQAVIQNLKPIQDEFKRIKKEENLIEILQKGAEKASEKASITIEKIESAIGVNYK